MALCIDTIRNCHSNTHVYLIADDMDDLSRSAKRLHIYRGLCSPSYISLKAVDIICHTFKLAVQLEKLAESEPEFNVGPCFSSELLLWRWGW